MKVLAIDTSTEACSAALLLPGGAVVSRFVLTERGHAELILPMIDAVLVEGGVALHELDGLAFGRGPGGFTGLRVAAGVIQGLAFGAGLEVAPVSSLAAVAAQVLTSPAIAGEVERGAGEGITSPISGEGVLVCNDARMNELYWAAYGFDAATSTPIALTDERVGPPASVVAPAGVTRCAGNGLSRHPELRARLEHAGLLFHDGVYPRAEEIARLGAVMLASGQGVAAAAALPIYVRDDVARPSGGAVTTVS